MKEEIKNLLKEYMAMPCSNEREGGNFYKVMSQDFKLSNGKIITREFVKKRKAAVILPITQQEKIVCIIQPMALTKEGSLLEVPAGYIEEGEEAEQGAIRELIEETGYVAKDVIYLGEHYQDPGSIKESVSAFVAVGCKKMYDQNLDDGENIITLELDKSEVIQLMDNNQIKDANTYIALAKSRFKGYI